MFDFHTPLRRAVYVAQCALVVAAANFGLIAEMDKLKWGRADRLAKKENTGWACISGQCAGSQSQLEGSEAVTVYGRVPQETFGLTKRQRQMYAQAAFGLQHLQATERHESVLPCAEGAACGKPKIRCDVDGGENFPR